MCVNLYAFMHTCNKHVLCGYFRIHKQVESMRWGSGHMTHTDCLLLLCAAAFRYAGGQLIRRTVWLAMSNWHVFIGNDLAYSFI